MSSSELRNAVGDYLTPIVVCDSFSFPLGSTTMPRALTLALTGDVMLGRLVNQAIARLGFEYLWGDMLPDLRQADLRCINLECALTSRTEPWTGDVYKPFFFRSEPRNVESLRVAAIDFACLANNHIADFGVEGLLDTIDVLDRAGIRNAGAGANLAAARRPARLTANGYRINVLAFADYPLEWAADSDHPGLNHCFPEYRSPSDGMPVQNAVRAARNDSDLVVFTIHWGPNMRVAPTEAFRRFARYVIDAGADIFWGHSAHLVQGIEIYRDKPVLYDTGDFVDDYAVDFDLRNDLSALFLVHVEPPHVLGIDLIPVCIQHMQVNRAVGDNRDWLAARVTELCRQLGAHVTETRDRLSILTG
jgi:poly-gamma-glutamate capsule biosynthesis protein CapA/YwtB (metallophosphatase superfamily)